MASTFAQFSEDESSLTTPSVSPRTPVSSCEVSLFLLSQHSWVHGTAKCIYGVKDLEVDIATASNGTTFRIPVK